MLLSALTLPKIAGEPESQWLERIELDWQVQATLARERGVAIHAAVEKHYRGEATPDLWEWVKAVREEILAVCGEQEWGAERSFSHPIGYGGKIDLHSPQWVLDFKTKDKLDPGRRLWDEEKMQLAAYDIGTCPTPIIDNRRCAVVEVCRDKPDACVIEAKDNDIATGWDMFRALLAFHQAKTGHRP